MTVNLTPLYTEGVPEPQQAHQGPRTRRKSYARALASLSAGVDGTQPIIQRAAENVVEGGTKGNCVGNRQTMGVRQPTVEVARRGNAVVVEGKMHNRPRSGRIYLSKGAHTGTTTTTRFDYNSNVPPFNACRDHLLP